MNKEFLGIRIKAWLVALVISALIIGIGLAVTFIPNIIKVVIIICVIFMPLYFLALCIDTTMECGEVKK